MVTLVARWFCSKRQCESQPSKLSVFPSSHCSWPARTPSPQTMFWQLLSQLTPSGGSHCSPGSTTLLPQLSGRHRPWRHTLPTSQAVPLVTGVRVEQVWLASSQVEAPAQGSVAVQLRALSEETQ